MSGETGSISPLALFVQADIIVKAVMIGLILASVLTWAIIISHHLRIKRLAREMEAERLARLAALVRAKRLLPDEA